MSLALPGDGRFTYPVHKRRTRENVAQMIEAEKNLDAFWQAVDQEMVNKGAITPSVAGLLSERVLRRTPEYQELPKVPNPNTYNLGTLVKPLSDIHFELQLRTEQTIAHEEASEPRLKIKTKGTGQFINENAEQEDICKQPESEEKLQIAVGKRSLKVFKTLFFIPSATAQPGEVAWSDFLHAMVSAGFSAQKLYGSV